MPVPEVLDYGDAAVDPLSRERSMLSIHSLVNEIAAIGVQFTAASLDRAESNK